jgi:dTDP-4-amino-4,6-dideoxygalactose transaminase
MHGRSYCLLVGNGTAGLTLCLEALALHGKRVAIPDSVCISVPLAVLYSENIPAYIDVEIDNLGPSITELESSSADLDAVIAVHGYGAICRIGEIESIAKKHRLPLIEDACLVQGGHVDGRPTGSFGLASVVSFGIGKPITLGHGGAILTDDLHLYRTIKSLDERLPLFSEKAYQSIDALGKHHTRLYNEHYSSDLEQHVELFQQMALESRQHFMHRFNDSILPRLKAGLDYLPREIDLRWIHWEKLSQALYKTLDDRIQIFSLPSGSVPWRLNILMNKDKRDTAMHTLHKRGLNASSWHPPVSKFFHATSIVNNTPVAHKIGEKILNLWVTDYSDQYTNAVCETLNSIEA